MCILVVTIDSGDRERTNRTMRISLRAEDWCRALARARTLATKPIIKINKKNKIGVHFTNVFFCPVKYVDSCPYLCVCVCVCICWSAWACVCVSRLFTLVYLGFIDTIVIFSVRFDCCYFYLFLLFLLLLPRLFLLWHTQMHLKHMKAHSTHCDNWACRTIQLNRVCRHNRDALIMNFQQKKTPYFCCSFEFD